MKKSVNSKIFFKEDGMQDIIVIGAGIIGTAVARKLAHYRVNVLVLESENDVAMGSTKANSAIVHGGYAEAHEKLKGRVCYKGRIQYEKLNRELNFGFTPIGSMVLAFEEKELNGLKNLMKNGEKNGLRDLKILNHDEIVKLEPNINPEVKYALYCEGAGVTSPYEMAIALMENAIHNGVQLKLNSKVKNIVKNGDIFEVETEDGNIYKSKIIVNAAGLNSAKISNLVGIDDYEITPRSGEYILFARGTGKLVNHVLFQMPTKMGKGILVTPTYHGNLLLGPDASNDNELDIGTHVERLKKIYEQAKKTTDKMEPNKFIRSFAGARAVSSTDDFVIRHSKVRGFVECGGIQSPGLTSSPAIADMVAEIIDKEIMKLELKEDFDPYRKPIIKRKEEMLPMKEVTKLVNMESGDERIVCRCEQVTEKTIIDAITREIPVTTIDGVKRRTRAGMGFCQGTFCRPRVAALMEKVLKIKVDPKFDTEHSGINRVGKSEFLEFLKKEN